MSSPAPLAPVNEPSTARRPIRVLHLRDSPWVDGPGRTILETGAHLDPARVEYHIGALVAQPRAEHPLVDAARGRGLNVIRIDDHGRLDREMIDRIVAEIDRLKIDILHTSEFRSNLLAQLCRRRRKLRLVATVHGWIANTGRRKLVRWLDKALLRRFDHVIAVSDATRELVPRWWLPDRRVTVLRNALVLKSYGSDVVGRPRRKIDPQGNVVMVNVGRLSPEKGQDLLLHALAALASKWPGLRLKFVGIGPLEQQLRSLAQSLGIADRVDFAGYVTDMPSLYAEVDLVVQSSFTEGLPNVILEAAYLRVPIAATAVGGTAEVVRHGHSAWLLEPRIDDLAAGIDAFMSNPQHFVAMAEQGHRDVVSQFSFDVRTERLTQVYEALMAERA